MPEKLEIEVLDGVVRASTSGAFSLGNAKKFFQEILHRAHEEGVDKILIDVRGITTEISTMARFEFGSHMAEQRPGQSSRSRESRHRNQGSTRLAGPTALVG